MISLAAAILLSLAKPSDDVVTVNDDQDVWVYPHASDPAGDSALRAWGVGGKAVAADAGEAEEFSYGYLRFSFNVPDGKKLVGASLVVTPVGTPEINPDSKKWPLEARPLVGTFAERSWSYDQVEKVHPSATDIFGTGVIAAARSGQGLEIVIDLMGKDSKFGDAFAKALKDKQPIYLALTSKYDVSEMGQKGVYKVYSKDNPNNPTSTLPHLELKFE